MTLAKRISGAAVCVVLWTAAGACSDDWTGGGTVGFGYTFLDATGDRSMSAETYDIYEDPFVSLNSVRLRSPRGNELTLDLTNVNLDSRSVRARFQHPGRLTVKGAHRKSRRIYDRFGDDRVFREHSDVSAIVRPHRAVRLTGGYAHTGRDGAFLSFGPEPFTDAGTGPGGGDVQSQLVDYDLKSYRIGVQLRHRSSIVDVALRSHDYTDNLDDRLERKAQRVRVTAFTPMPSLPAITVSAGLVAGWSEMESRGEQRKDNTGWGAADWTIAPQWSASYKLLFSRTDNEADGLETDNAVSTAVLTKQFPGTGELTLGY